MLKAPTRKAARNLSPSVSQMKIKMAIEVCAALTSKAAGNSKALSAQEMELRKISKTTITTVNR